MYIIIYTKYPSLVRSYKNIAKRQKSEVRSQISGITGSHKCVLLGRFSSVSENNWIFFRIFAPNL